MSRPFDLVYLLPYYVSDNLSSDMTPTVSLEVDLRISIYQLEAIYGWVTDQIRPAHLLSNQAPPCLGSS